MNRIEQIRQRLEKATLGPWRMNVNLRTLIASAPEDLKWALERLERAQELAKDVCLVYDMHDPARMIDLNTKAARFLKEL